MPASNIMRTRSEVLATAITCRPLPFPTTTSTIDSERERESDRESENVYSVLASLTQCEPFTRVVYNNLGTGYVCILGIYTLYCGNGLYSVEGR